MSEPTEAARRVAALFEAELNASAARRVADLLEGAIDRTVMFGPVERAPAGAWPSAWEWSFLVGACERDRRAWPAWAFWGGWCDRLGASSAAAAASLRYEVMAAVVARWPGSMTDSSADKAEAGWPGSKIARIGPEAARLRAYYGRARP